MTTDETRGAESPAGQSSAGSTATSGSGPRRIVGEVERCHKLLGGEHWSDFPETTIHALCDDGRTLCGLTPSGEKRGWFAGARIPRKSEDVSCGRCDVAIAKAQGR